MGKVSKQECTAKKKELFLKSYADKGNITKACEAVGIGRRTYYLWREDDDNFVKDFEIADKAFCDSLEAEMDRRAMEGVDKPIYYKGERVDTIKEYSDVLLIVRAKAKMPEKYKDRVEQQHTGNLPVTMVINLAPENKESN